MIYPRLKLKAEVFSNIVDGMNTGFALENEYEYESIKHFEKLQDEKKSNNRQIKKFENINQTVLKKMEAEEKRGSLGKDYANKAEAAAAEGAQSNISDFFFVNKTLKSRI